MAETGKYYDLEMQLKTKLFRLKAKSKIDEVKSLLRHTITCLYDKPPTDLLENTFLNIADSFIQECKGEDAELNSEDRSIFGSLTRKSHQLRLKVEVLEQKAAPSFQHKQNRLQK